MPKLKTKRAAAKRFKRTGKGGFKRHILTKKSPKTIRNLRGPTQVHESDVDEVKQMLPYA